MSGDAASVQVSLTLGTRGINYAPSSACSSGSDAIGQAYELICQGTAPVIVAGGTEAPVVPLALAAFGNIGALSKRNDDPKAACRPFDAERDGFALGEGAGIMVLEEAGHALGRGAPILAEIIGYSNTSDSFHLTRPSPDGEGAARAIGWPWSGPASPRTRLTISRPTARPPSSTTSPRPMSSRRSSASGRSVYRYPP